MPSIPKTKKKVVENADLLNLVGAVLSSAQLAKQKRGFRQRILRWRAALRKQTQKHPLLAIGIVVCFMLVAFFLGAVSTSLAQREKPSVSTTRGTSGSSGSAAALGKPGSAGPLPDGGQLVHRNALRQDIALELMQKVVTGNYSRRSDIATGRFLRDFEEQWALLDDVDRSKFELARRGPGWVQVRGPYRTSETRWKHRTHLSEGIRYWKDATEAMIRIVEENKTWKLEHIRVY